jgi:hypothetical protein
MSKTHPVSIQLTKEYVMARFAQADFGLNAASNPKSGDLGTTVVAASSEDSKTLAGMLLAAAMAALLVVADQVISTWTDGHLLAGWVALWTVAFAALAFLASPLRRVASFVAGAFTQWRIDAALRRDEEKMWEFALQDSRVMTELRLARSRALSD